MSYWTDKITEFSPVTVVNDVNAIKVEWEYIGEGWYGDYDDTDPTDEPLLRFAVIMRDEVTRDWEYVEDASYCTMLTIDTNPDELAKMAKTILDEFEDCVVSDRSWKRPMQEASWVGSAV